MTWIRSQSLFCLGLGLLLSLVPRETAAQLAPTGGHYAARASDTGFAGAVNSSGGYDASVPLDLPASRGGLPVPVQIVNRAHRVGAAGLGWDVPLSYIFRDITTIAYRRPANFADASPQAREHVLLMLNGQRIDLVRNAIATAWVARLNGAQLEVRDLGGDSMVMYDGEGRTYHFSAQGHAAGSRLVEGNLYLLRHISGPGGNNVHLEYSIGAPVLPTSDPQDKTIGLSIDLANVSYNPSPTTVNCYMNQVILNYDAAPPPVNTAPSPALSMSILERTVLARVHTLTTVDVVSRSTCTTDATDGVALRTYQLNYQSDPDTDQPQLQSVTMIGQQGTPERNTILPVAAFTYGTATNAAGGLTYRKTQSLALPSDVDPRGIANSFSDALGKPPAAPEYSQDRGSVTWQTLIDMNGDGRPDLTYVKDGQLFAALNIPGFRVPGNGGPVAFLGSMQVTGGLGNVLSTGALEMRSAQAPREPLPGGYLFNTDMVWRQSIDVNGDGRLDLIDAKEEAGSWVVYLNTPGPTDPSLVVWVRRTISIAPLVRHLREAGHSVSANYLPLSQRKTGAFVNFRTCWQWQRGTTGQFDWVKEETGYRTGACIGPPDSAFDVGPENTFVEWAVRDINGDGYPDVLFDSAPIVVENSDPKPFYPYAKPGEFRGSTRTATLKFSGLNNIQAMFNVAGMQVDTNTNAFSSPFKITSNTPTGSSKPCAVEIWRDGSLVCGFAEVNGDGLPDQFIGFDGFEAEFEVFLNTGSLNEGFFTAKSMIVTRILLKEHPNPQYQDCFGIQNPFTTYESTQLNGFRDLNGDGIPDLIELPLTSGTGTWRVRFGTGTRFSNEKLIDVPIPNAQFALSQGTENCGGTRSDTTRGLYDIDGDGQPEVVTLNPNDHRLDVYQLNATYQPDVDNVTSAPAAGRLVKIATGYGAVTTVGYRSAKEDFITFHNVPFPEIVVTAVGTSDEFGSSFESPTLYAYGDARLNFDSKYDAFIFPGYKRSVALRITSDQVIPPPTDGIATITDTYPLAPFDESMDSNARFKRYLKAGLVSDVTTISGNVGRDPWAVLDTNVNTDPRRISGTHYDWDTRSLSTGPSGNEFCIDMVYPYDSRRSIVFLFGHWNDYSDQCMEHGFVFQKSALSWRGTPGTTSPSATDRTVQTLSEVGSVDDFGRVLAATQLNDLQRPDDDICIQTVYATPIGSNERVLSAPASRTLTNCISPAVTFARDTWEYDTSASGIKLPPGRVSKGFVTGHLVSRLKLDNGDPIVGLDGTSDIRTFDATYDITTGKPITITKTREDGAVQKTTLSYDTFGLAPVSVKIDARNADGTTLPALKTTITRDNLTLNALSTTNPNGTQVGNTFDGFNRVLLSTVTPPGGARGALSSMSYLGFAVGETGGQRIVQKVFTDPVAPADVAAATGRTRTMFFDALARETRTEVALGADYGNQTLIAGRRFYDTLGRVQFEADPYLSGQNINDQYGTTYYFNIDGMPSCFIRGRGLQPLTNGPGLTVTDETNERYPTCFARVFLGNTEMVSRTDADALLPESPQGSVTRSTFFTAIGRAIQVVTYRDNRVPQERATFTYDVLGHMNSMTRDQNPMSLSRANLNPVTTTWHFDSLGQVFEFDEPDSAVQFRSHSNWGEVTQVQWCDAITSPCTDRRTMTKYDALGRVTHREHKTNNVVDAETVNDYTYDKPATFVTRVTPTNVRGRLASASWPTGRVSFSYDGLGRVNARGFDNRHGNTYIEKHTYHGDGSPSDLHLLLPDNSFKDERIDYTYDSAGKLRTAKYSDETGSMPLPLFNIDTIDPFGRIRQARIGLPAFKGPASYSASYADTGRRLLQGVKVTSATGTASREISYQAIPGTIGSVTAYDPLGRERVRQETTNGVAAPANISTYDALGRLDATFAFDRSNGVTSKAWQFSYDPLGNVLTHTDFSNPAASGSTTMTYQSTDRDRICSIGYGSVAPSTACDVKYNGLGNIIEQKSRSNGTRKFEYFANGQVKTIADGNGNIAYFRYDAFGAVQQLDLTGNTPDTRHDRHFGGLIAVRDETTNGSTTTPVITRTIPGPGFSATRHGPTGPWIFALGEGRGNRFFIEAGDVVQDVSYKPYGEAASTGLPPHFARYSSKQWNGGDTLAALGLSQLGARIYDPVIGRFLSRDPLLIPRTAATTNPYAFAMNDPVNAADPSGLDGFGEDSQPWVPLFPFGSGGGGSGGGSGAPASAVPHTPRGVMIKNVVQAMGYSPRGVHYDTLAATGASVPSMVDSILQSPSISEERDAATDAYNASLDTVLSFSAGVGDALTFWCPGCALVYREASGIHIRDPFAYGVGSATGILGTLGVGAIGAGGAAVVAPVGGIETGGFSRLAQPGGLMVSETIGGHTIAYHVARTEAQLAARGLAEASTFVTRAEAEAAIAGAFDANAAKVSNWVAAGAIGRLYLTAPFAGGQVLMRSTAAIVEGTGVFVVLIGNGAGEYFIKTGYVEP